MEWKKKMKWKDIRERHRPAEDETVPQQWLS